MIFTKKCKRGEVYLPAYSEESIVQLLNPVFLYTVKYCPKPLKHKNHDILNMQDVLKRKRTWYRCSTLGYSKQPISVKKCATVSKTSNTWKNHDRQVLIRLQNDAGLFSYVNIRSKGHKLTSES